MGLLEKSMNDDRQNDWLAQEMREENFHGCAEHGGLHQQSRTPSRGWDALQIIRENYEACQPHNGEHAAKQNRHDPHLHRMNGGQDIVNSKAAVIIVVVACVIVVNILIGLISFQAA